MPALTVANLLAWAVRVAAIVAIGGTAIHVARLESPRVRLACFRALLVACLAVPFVSVAPASSAMPAVGSAGASAYREAGGADVDVTTAHRASAPPTAAAQQRDAAAGAARPRSLTDHLPEAVAVIVFLGIAARLAWLLMGLFALRRLRREVPARTAVIDVNGGGRRRGAAPARASDADAFALVGARAEIVTSAAVDHPVTFGVVRPVVLLPESFEALNEAEQLAVLCHELLHVRRRDWAHAIVEEALGAVLWFHPAISWLLRRIDLSREQMVDREVVALTERRQPYLNALVTLAVAPPSAVLRPASLFLGRAHLLQRVALLSKEVRMSRPRLAISLALVTFVLVLGGQLVVRAFPLTGTTPTLAPASAPPAAAPTLTGAAPLVAPAPAAPSVAWHTDLPTVTVASTTAPQQSAAASIPAANYKAEPAISTISDVDRIVVTKVTIDAAGRVVDAEFVSGDQSLAPQAIDAARLWQFAPLRDPIAAVKTLVAMNFARSGQSGAPGEPVKIGGNIAPPTRIKNVRPVYPPDAQAQRVQGVVILELTIDGAGIPIDAYVLRSIPLLDAAAIDAALRWRYTPQPNAPRLRMTVTVNFVLDDGQRQAVSGGVVGGVSGGVAGGAAGGVSGGVVGGVTSGNPRLVNGMAPVRVGGNIQPPTRVKYVPPVYPAVAQDARVQGVVIVEIIIGTDGTVQDAKILRSIPLLDQAALDSVRQWEFSVTYLNGAPVPVIMTATVNFTLQ